MSSQLQNTNTSSNLSTKHRQIIMDLDKKLQENPDFLHNLCFWIKEKLGEKNTAHIDTLSDEGKYETCIENIIIALASGTLNVEDIKKLLNS